MKDKVFVPLTERGFKIDVCSKCGNDYLDKNYCYECKDIQEIITIKVKKNSDVLECLNKFKEARIFLDDNKRIGCINCNELSGFYYSIFNEDKQVFELKCSDCWFKECFGSVEEVKK